MMFEPGGKGLQIFQRDIPDWGDFKEYIKLLKSTNQFKTIVIDTVDIAYARCMTWVGKRNGFSHPSEKNDYGASWDTVKREFESTILELVNTGRGVLFISHAIVSEFQRPSGGTYNRIISSMPAQAQKFVSGFVDIFGYYGYYGEDRFLTIQGGDALESGHRVKGKFLVQGSQEKVISIPMGKSAEEGYQSIIKAFNNEQKDNGKPDEDTGLTVKKKLDRKR